MDGTVKIKFSTADCLQLLALLAAVKNMSADNIGIDPLRYSFIHDVDKQISEQFIRQVSSSEISQAIKENDERFI